LAAIDDHGPIAFKLFLIRHFQPRPVVMNKTDLIELAKRYFLADDALSTPNLIRKIQIAQGNADCFATGKRSCDQATCPWREDCFRQSAADSQFAL
jgi:hypothetical protein